MDGAKKLAYLLEGCGAKYTRTIVTEGTLFTVSTGDEQYFVLVRDDGAGIEMWSRYFTPEQAIVATVDMEKWEPSKEWKAWYNSLRHDNPTSIREAVENILYEAIDFGGDMGRIDGWVESVESIAATVGRSCASCPEMDNPDSYIMHLHRSLEVADRGAGTCEGSFHESGDLSSGRVPLYYCKGTNKSVFVEHDARFCPMCGKKLVRL